MNELIAFSACLLDGVAVLTLMAPAFASFLGSLATPSTVESSGTPFSGAGAFDGMVVSTFFYVSL